MTSNLTSEKLKKLFLDNRVSNKDFIRWVQRETGVVICTTSVSSHKSGVKGRGMSEFARSLYILYFKSITNIQRPGTLLRDLRKKQELEQDLQSKLVQNETNCNPDSCDDCGPYESTGSFRR